MDERRLTQTPPLWDTHVHLDQLPHPRSAVQRAIEAGVTTWVLVATSPYSYKTQSRLLKTGAFSGIQHIRAVGLHPEVDHPADALHSVWSIIHNEPIAAIGEIGLPVYRQLSRAAFNRNWEWLHIQLSWAEQRQLPVIIHAVHQSCEPMLRILEDFPHIPRVVFHWLKAPLDLVQEMIARHYFVGITPDVIWRERDQNLLSLWPPHQILLETDAPWPHRQDRQDGEPAEIRALTDFLDTWSPQPSSWRKIAIHNALAFFVPSDSRI
ncbi:hypothetical protein BXT84_07990 [Sulfobacillus thermotolerans]|uniref:Hydrolase TatD n=1 Tax=Sulfobacillus thermotolerans TaxID=338644 RepID=A0ABN5GZE2_9FIRM|nr:hypothetical protein BXT84_07990 [Sulfobacillus thermotolerans]